MNKDRQCRFYMCVKAQTNSWRSFMLSCGNLLWRSQSRYRCRRQIGTANDFARGVFTWASAGTLMKIWQESQTAKHWRSPPRALTDDRVKGVSDKKMPTRHPLGFSWCAYHHRHAIRRSPGAGRQMRWNRRSQPEHREDWIFPRDGSRHIGSWISTGDPGDYWNMLVELTRWFSSQPATLKQLIKFFLSQSEDLTIGVEEVITAFEGLFLSTEPPTDIADHYEFFVEADVDLVAGVGIRYFWSMGGSNGNRM